MHVGFHFFEDVLLEIVEDVDFALVEGIEVSQHKLYLFQLAVGVCAVRPDVEQFEVAGANVVRHQNKRVLMEDTEQVAVGLAEAFDLFVVNGDVLGLAVFDGQRRYHILKGIHSEVADLLLRALAVVERLLEMVDEEVNDRGSNPLTGVQTVHKLLGDRDAAAGP